MGKGVSCRFLLKGNPHDYTASRRFPQQIFRISGKIFRR